MARRSSGPRSIYARRFPHQVKLPARPNGYGRRLNEMEEWCRRRCGAHGEAWAMMGATFYFADAAIAGEFRAIFSPGPGQ